MKFRIFLLLAALNVLTCTASSAVIDDLPTSNLLFDPSQDFTIAVDYTLDFGRNARSLRDLGFGIGADTQGSNWAGVAMANVDGNRFLTFAGLAAINDQPLSPLSLGFTPSRATGSLFVQYVASSGDVIVGNSTTQGADTPNLSATYSGIQRQWPGDDLSVLFFARDKPTAESVFTNFRVLNGAPTGVPEPSQTVGAGIGLLFMVWLTRRRRQRGSAVPAPGGPTNSSRVSSPSPFLSKLLKRFSRLS